MLQLEALEHLQLRENRIDYSLEFKTMANENVSCSAALQPLNCNGGPHRVEMGINLDVHNELSEPFTLSPTAEVQPQVTLSEAVSQSGCFPTV